MSKNRSFGSGAGASWLSFSDHSSYDGVGIWQHVVYFSGYLRSAARVQAML